MELFQNQKTYEKLTEQGKEQKVLETISDEIEKLETKLADLTKNKFQYTTEAIFQKVEEIESENILMYKLRPEKYQEYVEAKITLESAIQEMYWKGKSFEEKMQSFPLVSVQINPNSMNLEITLDDIIKNDVEKTKQYETVIEHIMPDEIPWIVIFSND